MVRKKVVIGASFLVVIAAILACVFLAQPIAVFAESALKYSIVNNVKTLVAAPPVLASEIKTVEEYNAVKENGVQVAILKVNGNGNVVLGKEEKPLETAAKEIKGKSVIPAFRFESESEATALTNNLNGLANDNKVYDLFFVSKSVSALKAARNAYNMAKGILDFTGKNFSDPFEVTGDTFKALASIAIIDGDKASKKTTEYFRDSFLNIWTVQNSSDIFEVLKTISTGVHGIVADLPKTAVECLNKFNNLTTLVRAPAIIGHRGASLNDIWTPETDMQLPENSMAAFKYAYENSADLIELDILFSSDKELMVIHDDIINKKLNTPNNAADIKVSSLTRAQIQNYEYRDCLTEYKSERVPTLSQVFNEFKGKDIRILVEIKEDKPGLGKAAAELVKKEGMEKQVTFLSFYPNQLLEAREVAENVGGSFLTFAAMDSSGSDANVSAMLEKINGYQYGGTLGYSPNTGLFNSFLFKQLNMRGTSFNGWTYNNPSVREEHIGYGVQSLTVDVPQYFNEAVCSVETEQESYTALIGETVDIKAKTTTYKGEVAPLTGTKLTPIIISGDSVKISNNIITAKKEGTTIVVPRYRNFGYTIMGAPIKIEVKAEAEEKGGCKSRGGIIFSLIALAFAGLIVTKKATSKR